MGVQTKSMKKTRKFIEREIELVSLIHSDFGNLIEIMNTSE